MKHVLFLSTMLVSLTACSASPDLPPGYRLGAQGPEGLAVVSLTLSGQDLGQVTRFSYRIREAAGAGLEEAVRRPHFNSARQHMKWLRDKGAQGPRANLRRVVVKDLAAGEPLDVVESGRLIGRLAVVRLPAGEYEFYDWRLVVPNKYGRDEFGPQRAVGYRFRVEAGRATYLGNLDLYLTGQDGYKVSVESKAGRDLALLAKKAPSLQAEVVVKPAEL